MGIDFSKFDKEVNLDQLKADAEEIEKNGGTGEYTEIEEGVYTCKVDKLEVGATKDGRPMLKAQFRIVADPHKNQCIFMNRVLYGTKNDANMIAAAVGWIKTLEPSEDIKVEFESYSQFNEMVLDVAEDIAELEYEVYYDPNAFNNIAIQDVFE